jgi:hypothetical protein
MLPQVIGQPRALLVPSSPGIPRRRVRFILLVLGLGKTDLGLGSGIHLGNALWAIHQ